MMSIIYRDKNLAAVKERYSMPCFVNINENGKLPALYHYMDFLLPIMAEKGTDTYMFNTNHSFYTYYQRKRWIRAVKSLYNFAPHFAEIGKNGEYVRFDLNKTPGFMIFAIGTTLRYFTEFPVYCKNIYALKRIFGGDFKKAFVTHHFFMEYSSGHCLLQRYSNYEKALTIEGYLDKDVPVKERKDKPYLYKRLWDVFSPGLTAEGVIAYQDYEKVRTIQRQALNYCYDKVIKEASPKELKEMLGMYPSLKCYYENERKENEKLSLSL